MLAEVAYQNSTAMTPLTRRGLASPVHREWVMSDRYIASSDLCLSRLSVIARNPMILFKATGHAEALTFHAFPGRD